MQDHDLLQLHTQPYLKLAQANIELFTRFAASPETTAQAASTAMQIFQQVSESATGLMPLGAFAELMQGLMRNHAEFLNELSRSSLTLMSAGQAAFMRQAQEVTADAIETASGGAGRSRRAR